MNTSSPLDCIVIGAGQAGLAAGYYLKKAGRNFLILNADERVGDNWRKRWDGLRLFSPNQYNALPGLPPSGDPLHLPDRLELADYLETYANHFQLPVVNNCTCTSIELGINPFSEGRAQLRAQRSGEAKMINGTWEITTSNTSYRTTNVIVATGAYRTPVIPAEISATFPGQIPQYHSSEIRQVAEIADAQTSVLVVGAGASGMQLSRLFHQIGAEVTLAGRDLPNLPRNFLGKDIYWWLYKSGMITLRNDKAPGKWLLADGAGDLTVGEAPLSPDIRRIKTKVVCFGDGNLLFDCKKTMPDPLPWPRRKKGVVIWCTGYKNAYPFLPEAAVDQSGRPLHEVGRSTTLPGLYFLGLPNLQRPNSSLVGGVGRDAERIVGDYLVCI